MGLLSKQNSDGNEMMYDFHFPTSKKALIIFTRNPKAGQVKTRLAKTIGDEATLKIYTYLLKHTANVAKQIKADKYVFYSENITKNDLWDDDIFRKKMQNGSDLGTRMYNAFSELFGLGYEKVLIIGSDLLDLEEEHIENAFYLLNQHEIVIGPSKDGGYYLLGLKMMYRNIFENKAWGTETVFDETSKDLKHCDVVLLEELNDIDTFEDMKHYKQLEQFYI